MSEWHVLLHCPVLGLVLFMRVAVSLVNCNGGSTLMSAHDR